MDPIEAKRINALERTVNENNKLLRKLHRGMITRRIMTTLYWVIIIGISVGALYFLQPYIELLQNTIEQLGGVLDLFQSGAAAGSIPVVQ